jgi:hypothetical protein
MAAGNANRCTNCNRLGHTAGKCVSKVRLSPAAARAEKSIMSVISCYNCGRLGHLLRNVGRDRIMSYASLGATQILVVTKRRWLPGSQ